LADTHGQQEFLFQHFARMDVGQFVQIVHTHYLKMRRC
jgi:hypothetical protein